MKWWRWLGLRTRLYIIVATLMLTTLGGGVIMIWYTYRIESLCSSIIDRNVVAIHSVDAIQANLVNQKGFVSYYFIDGNPYWLDQLKSYRKAFLQNLKETKEFRLSHEQADLIRQIEQQYTLYVASQDHVISLLKDGKREAGIAINEKIRFHFFELIDLCNKYKEIQVKELNAAWEKTHTESVRLRALASTALLLAIVMFAVLTMILLFEILRPIKMLANEANRAGDKTKSSNEVATLGHRVRNLIEDVKQTRIELEQSRARLLQSAKMAAIGRFSAEMAHTIRNPMASIEMRLYSIEQKIELTDTQKEDFEAIYDDMNFLDNFIRNFLEFSRPPNLKKQEVYVSDILDTTLQLIEPQIKQLNINVERNYPEFQPYIEADPELLKEVFVNLIVNACEAMGDNGNLIISEEIVKENQGIKAVLVRIKDNGPGIPLSVQEKLWEPFFTTKAEGTGLGLSIAMRIIEEHKGQISVESEEGSGATFIIILPVLPIEE